MVPKLFLVEWKNTFLVHIQNKNAKPTVAILRLIDRQRDGQEIDQGLIKKVLDSFVSLGFDEADINKPHLGVYKEHFEIPFQEATQKYYELQSRAFLTKNSISDYLKQAEEWLGEEEGQVERYLDTNMRKPLISKCKHILIHPHIKPMHEIFLSLIDHDKDEDLKRMYTLLARIPNSFGPLWDKFEEHVRKAGLAAIMRLIGEGGLAAEVDPKAYIDTLFEVHHKWSEAVKRSFGSEDGFITSLDKACGDFINNNTINGTLSTRSPDLLAKRVDALLRKNNTMVEEDLEGSLNQVVCTFSGKFSV